MIKRAGLLICALAVACTSSPPASPLPSLDIVASPTASPAVSVRPPTNDDLASLLHPLVTSWSPEGTTLLVSVRGADGLSATVQAVPLDGRATPTPLVTISRTTGSAWRADGSAFAVGVETAPDSARIAAWDPKTGAAWWITADEPGVRHESPVWSADGRVVYYAAHASTPTSYRDLGIFRIGLDGSGKTLVYGPDGNGGMPVGLTPDGARLVWVRVQAGGGTEVLDLEAGGNREFDPTGGSYPEAWRSARPRALVISGGCCAGKPGGTLVLWDEVDGSSRVVGGIDKTSKVTAGAAAWDPTGMRIAVQLFDISGLTYTASIATIDADGTHRSTIPGTEGAGSVLWLREGIVFSRSQGTEIVFVSPEGDGLRVLFRSASYATVSAISP
jgi:hypothetical protein